MNKIRNQRREVTTGATEIERLIRDYHENLNANKLNNFKEVISSQKHTLFLH